MLWTDSETLLEIFFFFFLLTEAKFFLPHFPLCAKSYSHIKKQYYLLLY